MRQEISGNERIMALLAGEKTDRAAVISPTSVANIESMKAVGVYFPAAHRSAEKMAALAAAGHELLGFDSVCPYFGVQQEASALGCEIDWGTPTTMPGILTHPLREPSDFRLPADFLDLPPIKATLGAIRLLKAKCGGRVSVIGKVMGPWTLAYHLRGVQDFLIDLVLDPQKARDFLGVLKEVSLTFALAQAEAGADLITWADHATGDLVNPRTYEVFLLPIHRDCTAAFKKACPHAVPLILHTCGSTLDRVWFFSRSGFELFHFDSKNDPKKMLSEIRGKMKLTGCVNNPKILLNGSPEEVSAQVREILDAGIRLVSPECAIPPRVSSDNLRAVVRTVKAFKEH